MSQSSQTKTPKGKFRAPYRVVNSSQCSTPAVSITTPIGGYARTPLGGDINSTPQPARADVSPFSCTQNTMTFASKSVTEGSQSHGVSHLQKSFGNTQRGGSSGRSLYGERNEYCAQRHCTTQSSFSKGRSVNKKSAVDAVKSAYRHTSVFSPVDNMIGKISATYAAKRKKGTKSTEMTQTKLIATCTATHTLLSQIESEECTESETVSEKTPVSVNSKPMNVSTYSETQTEKHVADSVYTFPISPDARKREVQKKREIMKQQRQTRKQKAVKLEVLKIIYKMKQEIEEFRKRQKALHAHSEKGTTGKKTNRRSQAMTVTMSCASTSFKNINKQCEIMPSRSHELEQVAFLDVGGRKRQFFT